MKFKLRKYFAKTDYNNEHENLTVATVLIGFPTIAWLSYTILRFITWQSFSWTYTRMTVIVFILIIIYLLTVFKIEKNHEE